MAKEQKKEVVEEISINNVGKIEEKLKEAIEKNPENKPTEEEVISAEKEFAEESENFNTSSYEIGSKEDAKELIDYTKHFIENRAMWSKNAWMGMIKFKQELEDADKFLKDNTDKAGFRMGYQAIEFLYFLLQNPGGIGYDSAKAFETENSKFVKLFDATADMLQTLRDRLKKIQFLQDKVTAMKQGFYLELETEEDRNEIETDTEEAAETNTQDAPELVVAPVK
jgi:hypothetical protein